MNLDALTAGIALVLVQLCVALIMAGIFYALPSEKCTRYWAASGICVALGLLFVILNGGAPRALLLILGNNILVLGLVFQWSGIRSFYRKATGYAGWAVMIAFFIVYLALIIQGATISMRAVAGSVAILAMLLLYLYEVISGQARRYSFASLLAMISIVCLIVAYAFRLGLSVFQIVEILPRTNSLLSVSLLYFVPIAGTMLLSCALLLLYFERIVADKHHLATHDELTKVLNRRAIVAGGMRELAVAKRLHKPLAVGFVDIDHFKAVNDQFGHEAGDSVLAEVAQVLQRTCRHIDLVGRYGGEEFCIVFPNLDQQGCHTVGERIISAINRHPFSSVPQVTISLGMAAHAAGEETKHWQDLIHAADLELYKAKHAGRNQVCVAT